MLAVFLAAALEASTAPAPQVELGAHATIFPVITGAHSRQSVDAYAFSYGAHVPDAEWLVVGALLEGAHANNPDACDSVYPLCVHGWFYFAPYVEAILLPRARVTPFLRVSGGLSSIGGSEFTTMAGGELGVEVALGAAHLGVFGAGRLISGWDDGNMAGAGFRARVDF